MKRLAAPPLLIDFGAVPETHCDDCLEQLFKAIAANPSGKENDIWRPLDDPFISQHVEDVTAWMQRILAAIQDAMARAFGLQPGDLRKAMDWDDRDDAQRAMVRARLEAKGPANFTLTDWLDLADLLIAEYLPPGVIRDMGDFLAVRAALMGKIKAATERTARPNAGMRALAAALPMTRRNLPPKLLTAVESSILDLAAERAAMFISDVAEDARKRMKSIILEKVRMQVLGEAGGTASYLERALFDEFGQLNRDMRRIAVTETSEAYNTGFIAGQPIGATVRRLEAYRGACEFCQQINGMTFRVVEASDPRRNGERDVWVGKTNARRSASPKQRQDGLLVDRPPEDRWWVAAGVQHPHCRGSWTSAGPAAPTDGTDPEFMAWLRGALKKIEVPAP